MDSERMLLSSLSPVGAKEAVLLWRTILQRRILWSLEQQGRPLELLSVGENRRVCLNRGVGEKELSAEVLRAFEQPVLCSAFNLQQQDIEWLLKQVKDAVKEASPMRLRVLILFQTCECERQWRDLSYFGTFLNCASSVILGLARAAFEQAQLFELEPCGVSCLLDLPPQLAAAASSSYVVSISVPEESSSTFSCSHKELYESVSMA